MLMTHTYTTKTKIEIKNSIVQFPLHRKKKIIVAVEKLLLIKSPGPMGTHVFYLHLVKLATGTQQKKTLKTIMQTNFYHSIKKHLYHSISKKNGIKLETVLGDKHATELFERLF